MTVLVDGRKELKHIKFFFTAKKGKYGRIRKLSN